MKTDLTEIFQTIRAGLQPYATLGYTVHENSESGYDLYSEKNVAEAGEHTTERFFAGVYINGDEVEVRLNSSLLKSPNYDLVEFSSDQCGLKIEKLDDSALKEVETTVEIIHSKFKEKEWI